GVARPEIDKIVLFWLFAILLITVARSVARAVCRRSATYVQNTIIVGAGTVGQAVARKLLRHPEYGINLLGFVDSPPLPAEAGLERVPLLGSRSELVGLVRAHDVDRVVIAFSNDSTEETLDVIRSLNDADVQIDIVPRLFELVSPSVQIDTLEGLPLV